MKERNLKYEQKFRTYLFSFDFETHKEICKNINVKHNQEEKEEKDYCDRCEKYIDQVDLGNGSWGCPLCKCDDQIITFYQDED